MTSQLGCRVNQLLAEQCETSKVKYLPSVVSLIISGSVTSLYSGPSRMPITSFALLMFTFLFIWHWKDLALYINRLYINRVTMASWAENIFPKILALKSVCKIPLHITSVLLFILEKASWKLLRTSVFAVSFFFSVSRSLLSQWKACRWTQGWQHGSTKFTDLNFKVESEEAPLILWSV